MFLIKAKICFFVKEAEAVSDISFDQESFYSGMSGWNRQRSGFRYPANSRKSYWIRFVDEMWPQLLPKSPPCLLLSSVGLQHTQEGIRINSKILPLTFFSRIRSKLSQTVEKLRWRFWCGGTTSVRGGGLGWLELHTGENSLRILIAATASSPHWGGVDSYFYSSPCRLGWGRWVGGPAGKSRRWFEWGGVGFVLGNTHRLEPWSHWGESPA